jgi:hypothetical protein
VSWGRNKLDEILELLDKNAKRVQKSADETKEAVWKEATIYEQLQHSPEASSEQKLKAFVKKTLELDRLEWLNSQLVYCIRFRFSRLKLRFFRFRLIKLRISWLIRV